MFVSAPVAPQRQSRLRPLHVLAVVVVLVALGLTGTGVAHADTVVGGRPAAADPVELVLFWVDGCPHCAAEKVFLADLEQREPALVIRAYEISGSPENRARFAAAGEALGFVPNAVPTTIIGDRHWIGFDDAVGEEIAAAVAAAAPADDETAGGSEPDGGTVMGPAPVDDGTAPAASGRTVEVPLVGTVDLESQSLVVGTALIGFLDGFNPCSLWVLSLLLALVLHTGSRRRVLAVGATFLVVTTALYGVYIGGLYSVLTTIAYSTWIRAGVAAVAGVFGLINVKDYFAFQRGPSLTINPKHKPGIVRRMRAVARPDRPLLPVLGATAVLAVGVSLVETPCSAGFPVIWTNMLTARDVGLGAAVALFALYMMVFLADELAVFGAAVVTMRAAKLQEHHGRLLKLVGGVVMLTLAATMLLAPDLLDSVTGTAAIFGGAGLVTLLVVGLHHLAVPVAEPPVRRAGRRGATGSGPAGTSAARPRRTR